MSKVIDIFPANDFKVVCENASKDIKCGLIIGYDENNEPVAFGGGLLNKKQPVSKDWLWIVTEFKHKLLNGDFDE
jgi:hypothetical protein